MKQMDQMLLMGRDPELEDLERRALELETQLVQIGTQQQEAASWEVMRKRPKSSVPDTSVIKKKLKIMKDGGKAEEDAVDETCNY